MTGHTTHLNFGLAIGVDFKKYALTLVSLVRLSSSTAAAMRFASIPLSFRKPLTAKIPLRPFGEVVQLPSLSLVSTM